MPLVALWALASASSVDSAPAPSFLFLLGDDIGWADMGYNNGTAATPRIDAWAARKGSLKLQDFHSGGTVCSPTRASVLTGRNPWRDCVDGVYGCSDPTECTPHFNFAPQRTFTIGDAARAAGIGAKSQHFGKWHLGSFYNDSEAHGGITSSPVTHGFDDFNSTIEVAPTATTNCGCDAAWIKDCDFGHNHKCTHNNGGPGPAGSAIGNGCCFNYWWRDDDAANGHGIANLTSPVPDDDSAYLADSFMRFVAAQAAADHAPFVAQVSFHNCHKPFIGTNASRAACLRGETCAANATARAAFTDTQLDFYACLTELDASVGRVLDALDAHGYGRNTMVWFTTDNGPEGDCGPEGICDARHFEKSPGSAGPLRGRKRDTWEGGHRVPGIVSWPAVVPGDQGHELWDTIITTDFLSTLRDVLGVAPPDAQAQWATDCRSILPLLKEPSVPLPERSYGWVFNALDGPKANYGFRQGRWKYVLGTRSCTSSDCAKPLLYDLSTDLGERHDLAAAQPSVLASISANFSAWLASVNASRVSESLCGAAPPPTPTVPTPPPPPAPPTPPTPAPPPAVCTFANNTGMQGDRLSSVSDVKTEQLCCDLCGANPRCTGADFHPPLRGASHDGGVEPGACLLYATFTTKQRGDGSVACQVKRA